MKPYHKQAQASPESQAQAEQLAKGLQKPGQTKEQSQRIAQGIAKGIAQYKKQQKAKARAMDKEHRQKMQQLEASSAAVLPVTANKSQAKGAANPPAQSHLPWWLLGLSWLLFIGVMLGLYLHQG